MPSGAVISPSEVIDSLIFLEKSSSNFRSRLVMIPTSFLPSVMGSMFAGCDESPGTFELYQGRKYKVYRGMGSIAAMENGSKDRYFQTDAKKLVPEAWKPCGIQRSVEDTVFQLMGACVPVWDTAEPPPSKT